MSIIDNYNVIKENIAKIIKNANSVDIKKQPDEVKIIAVSKRFPADIVQKALDSGITILGENKIQEAKNKFPLLHGKFEAHMIGHLQSNKAKEAVQLFDLIHSIDKISTAQKLSDEAAKINKIQKILIQINVSGEETKSGIKPEEAIPFIKELMMMKNLSPTGIMTMAPNTQNKTLIKNIFRKTAQLLKDIQKAGFNLKELSMGMSSDYKIAVEEGATMIRIGTAIFGQRDYSK